MQFRNAYIVSAYSPGAKKNLLRREYRTISPEAACYNAADDLRAKKKTFTLMVSWKIARKCKTGIYGPVYISAFYKYFRSKLVPVDVSEHAKASGLRLFGGNNTIVRNATHGVVCEVPYIEAI